MLELNMMNMSSSCCGALCRTTRRRTTLVPGSIKIPVPFGYVFPNGALFLGVDHPRRGAGRARPHHRRRRGGLSTTPQYPLGRASSAKTPPAPTAPTPSALTRKGPLCPRYRILLATVLSGVPAPAVTPSRRCHRTPTGASRAGVPLGRRRCGCAPNTSPLPTSSTSCAPAAGSPPRSPTSPTTTSATPAAGTATAAHPTSWPDCVTRSTGCSTPSATPVPAWPPSSAAPATAPPASAVVTPASATVDGRHEYPPPHPRTGVHCQARVDARPAPPARRERRVRRVHPPRRARLRPAGEHRRHRGPGRPCRAFPACGPCRRRRGGRAAWVRLLLGRPS